MREMKDSGGGWIGEIPKEKIVLRNKYIFTYEKGKLPISTNFEKLGFPYIGASDLENEYSIYTEDAGIPNAEYDDLLVLWDGARAGLCGTHKVGKISSTVVRIRGNKTIYPPFLYWYYKGFEDFMFQSVNGTTIPHMNRKYIEMMGWINWTMDEQHCIADYLGAKCAKIDNIISKQQKIIEKLKAYKLSFINENINSANGTKCHLGYIGKMKNGLNFSSTLEGKKIKFLGVGDFQDYFVLDEIGSFSDIITTDEIPEDYMLRDGDIIFVRSNGSKELVGRAVMVKNINYPLAYSGFCIRFRNTRLDIIDSNYLLYFFRSPDFRKKLERYSRGSNINNMNQELLSQIEFTFPDMESQRRVVQFLDKKCSKINIVIENKLKLIDKLAAYKKSLIYEAVTGKKELAL